MRIRDFGRGPLDATRWGWAGATRGRLLIHRLKLVAALWEVSGSSHCVHGWGTAGLSA